MMRISAGVLLITIIIAFCSPLHGENKTFEQRYDLNKKIDEILDKVFYKPKFQGSLYIYIIHDVKTNDLSMRAAFTYRGDKWLEIKRYVFIIDGERYGLTPNKSITRTRVDDFTAEETVEIDVPEGMVQLLRMLVKAKKAIIRHDGEEAYHDYPIEGELLISLRLTMAAYDELKASLDKKKEEKTR
jgi:hypothetical protein